MVNRTEANARLALVRTLPDRYLREMAEAMADEQRQLGKRIRDARDEKGWKQKELARRAHVEPTTVSRWERGKSAPDLSTLEVLADVLDKPVTYFVSNGHTPAAALDEIALRQMFREEVAVALAPLEQLLQRLADPAQPKSRKDGHANR